jgi:hypothetical protein
MSITFTVFSAEGYFLSKYQSKISDDEFERAYKDFYQGDTWLPNLNELVDVSEADVSEVTTNALRRVAEFTKSILNRHGVEFVKLAVYAPGDLPYGLARMYSAFADESPETVRVFRDLAAAKRWLGSANRE